MSEAHWNRHQAGGLLLAGAGTIAAFQTALFSTWVDATTGAGGCDVPQVADIVAWVGLISTILMATVWVMSRVVVNRPLKSLGPGEQLHWWVSAPILVLFLWIAVGWGWLLLR